MVTKSKGCIFLRKTGLDYFVSDSTNVVSVEYPSTVVQDVEVLNREELLKLIQTFIANNKILPGRSIVVLSDSVLFQKDVTVAKPEDLEVQKKMFLNNVPFEHVASKEYPLEKITRIITTNADLFKDIQYIFEKLGFQISQVVAPISLGKDFKMGERLTTDLGKMFIQKMDTIKSTDNFLEQPQSVAQQETLYTPTAQKKKPAKSRLPLLLPVFGILIAVLAGMFYMQSKDTTYVARGAEKTTPIPTIAPLTSPTVAASTTAPSPTISVESIVAQNKDLKIQILNGSNIPGQAEKGKNQLAALGFENIKTGNADNVNTEKTLVIFKQPVPQSVRDIIYSELKKTYEEISTQETADGENDVIITLGHLIVATP